MMTDNRTPTLLRCCATIVATALLAQPLAAYAVPITTSVLAESPLQGENPVKPNIMFTLDDSTSMLWEFLPDYTGAAFDPRVTYCRTTSVTSTSPCGITTPSTGFVNQSDPPFRSSDFNGQYYNPNASYTPGKRADGTDLPCEGTSVACSGPWTGVYANGYAGYPAANGGPTTNVATGYPDTAWCNTHGSGLTAADLATAFTDGSRCRLNGRSYSAFTAFIGAAIDWTAPATTAGYNYPNAINVANGSATTCANATEDCIYSNRAAVTGNPYYYRISKVRFCPTSSWLPLLFGGYGTGACQDAWDKTTNKYVRYGTDATKAFDPQAFTRVDITPAGFLVNGVAGSNPSGRSYADEMANFAKWYAFYRTRMLSMKTAGGKAFFNLNQDNARVGFHTLWENASATAGFLNVVPFNSANKATWFSHFYAATPPAGAETPLPDAVYRVGEYFSNSGNSGLSGAADPLDATTGKCQSNYHLLSTDGLWNIARTASSVGDQDLTVPSLPGPIPGFTTGSQFPRPYYEGPTASSNSLADLAMRYWINDIRPSIDNNVQDAVAPWQHVTLYGLSIGAKGSVDANGLAAITAGTADWPQPRSSLPEVWSTAPGDPPGLTRSPGADSIDDLYHAAVNSRGKFFNAANAQQLAESIVSALADFTGASGTGASVGIGGAQITSSRNFGYLTSYNAQLTGDVRKYTLDPATGALPADTVGNPLNPPVWSAQVQLDAQAAGAGWDTNRRILTMNDATNSAVPFRWASLSPAQQASLNAGWSVVTPTPASQDVLDYLRGNRSNEGVTTTNFRVRTHVLGDIVYSAAIPVGAPAEPYSGTQPGYDAFVTAQRNRTPMLYVGGNDGMLHAINDSSIVADAGKEAWAYVPKALFSGGDPNDSAHTPDPAFQLGALSYRIGGSPPFRERFYVNATPRIWNIDFANTNTNTPPQAGNDWRTMLVGGLGAGGRSVYALDVTVPVALTDSEASIVSSGRVLWEISSNDPDFADLGYVYDAPTLVKTYRYGWVALIASGYNNAGGKGILYIVNPTDGRLLKKLSTGVGTDADPSGLSTIRAFTASRKDPYVLQAYGGDLKGNVWRFDLSDPDESNWKVELFAHLKDAGGNDQPITTGVRIEVLQPDNVIRYVFVGTGKLLATGDIADASVGNTLYAIVDGTVTTPGPALGTLNLRGYLDSVSGATINGIAGVPSGHGWYQDATDPSQKIGTDVFADVNTVVFAFSNPQSDPCLGILASTLYARDFTLGQSTLQSAGGDVQSSIAIGGVAGIRLIQASDAVKLQVTTLAPSTSGPIRGQVFTFGVKVPGGTSLKHRVSWRTINKE